MPTKVLQFAVEIDQDQEELANELIDQVLQKLRSDKPKDIKNLPNLSGDLQNPKPNPRLNYIYDSATQTYSILAAKSRSAKTKLATPLYRLKSH